MRLERKSRLARGIDALARFSVARPRTVLALAALLVAASILASVTQLGLRTSNLDLIDPNLPEVRAFREFAETFGSPNALIVVLESQDATLLGPAAERLLPHLEAGPGVRSVLGKLPGDPLRLAMLRLSPYFLSRDGGMLFVFVQPEDPESRAETIAPFVEAVRRAIADSGIERDGVRAGLTGLPQYALDDRDVVSGDIRRLSGLSFVLVMALFMAAFASFLRPLLVMLTLATATAVLMGAAVLWPGHLTLLSSFFGSIVFGMGVDFGILIVDRLEEHLAEGEPGDEGGGVPGAALRAIEALSPGLATGALTTAMGFFAMQLTGFRGFAELGGLAGMGIVASLLAMVTVLPALLVLVHRGRHRERRLSERRIGRVLLGLQHPALALALVSAALLSLALGWPGFDSDYLNLEPRGSEAVRLEREMVERSNLSPQFAAFTVASEQEAAALAERLRREETVGAVHWSGELALLTELTNGVAVDEACAQLGPGAGGELAKASGCSDGALAELRARFVDRDGHQAVYAYPKGDVWEPAVRDRFLAHMQAIDPSVTGMPVLGRFMIELSQRALRISATLALAILVICVWLDLRDVRLALLALMPTALGIALMLGSMRALGIAFNPLNVMALPVVIGIGEDNAVHLLHRLLEERGDLARALAGTGRGLLLTSGTTVASFIALSFASHQGLATFAQALALGVASTLAMSLLVLPQAARWLLARRGIVPPAVAR